MKPQSSSPLPAEIPVFPLSSLLLPGASLPLNIFEPRYLAMVEHAVLGDRLIGMVHADPGSDGVGSSADSPLLPLGCAGAIESMTRLPDGRIALSLAGVSRFEIARELPIHPGGFRRVRADWSPFEVDREVLEDSRFVMDRERLCHLVNELLPAGLKVNRMAVDGLDNAALLKALAMQTPLCVWDMQAVLEAAPGEPRAQALSAALECAVAIRRSAQSSSQRH